MDARKRFLREAAASPGVDDFSVFGRAANFVKSKDRAVLHSLGLEGAVGSVCGATEGGEVAKERELANASRERSVTFLLQVFQLALVSTFRGLVLHTDT